MRRGEAWGEARKSSLSAAWSRRTGGRDLRLGGMIEVGRPGEVSAINTDCSELNERCCDPGVLMLCRRPILSAFCVGQEGRRARLSPVPGQAS